MRLNNEEYRKADGLLRRYNYNCITIINLKDDIIGIGAANYDGMPKAPYKISDPVFNQVVSLYDNELLQKALKEYKIVNQVYALVSKDCKDVFEDYYQKQLTKWETINHLGLSARTFERRKKDLIYAVHEELKNWRKVGEKI